MIAMDDFEWDVQGYYHPSTGWETVDSFDGTPAGRADAVKSKQAYDQAEPQFAHRVKKVEVNQP